MIARPITLAVLGISMLAGGVFAADPTGTTTPPTPTGTGGGAVVNPAALPPEVKALAEKFQDARANFLASQKALEEKLKNATNDQRAQLLEAIKDLRQKWLDQSKALRAEIRDHIKDVERELSSKRQKQLNAAKEKGRTGGGKP